MDGVKAKDEFVDSDRMDTFHQHIDDKFYYHEAQLRDLYYLQVSECAQNKCIYRSVDVCAGIWGVYI